MMDEQLTVTFPDEAGILLNDPHEEQVDTQPIDPIDLENTVSADNPAWLPERLERARRGAVQSLVAELGFSDVDGLRVTLTEQQNQISQLTQERDHAVSQATLASNAQRTALLEAAFIHAAGQYDFIHPDEARRLLEWDRVEIDEHGAVVGMKEAMGRLVETRPHLLRRRSSLATDARIGGDAVPRTRDVSDLPPEQIEDLKRRFKLW